MSNRSATKVGSEPIPGYTLRKRLGAGGYGEVWLADAPGGLQKAIKLIYGTVDQSHASSELRSLQRIRQVYHPFLLSIERIEIVDSQVVIVTELAESSLLDRFEQCRRRGAQGVDRGPLLDFLRDAADALDFLAQKHSLQHLDVKPGNLLIIADRIKVADFGLIKDLHDQNQSLVSGLTPAYSAPEIFDGRPDYRSDQYSLAIVYMEMLSGQLPFSGKSTGELARQHLTLAPDLESLPPADRPVVARALAKNPLDRFSTCRQFVEQLLKTRGAALPALQAKTSATVEEVTEEKSTFSRDRKTSTTPNVGDQGAMEPAFDLSGLIKQWNNARAMFIGLGGMGGRALLKLHNLATRDCDNRLSADDHGWSVIDTDANALDAITNEEHAEHLPPRFAFELPIFRPNEYRNAEPDLFSPLSRRWLYNIPRSLKTEGVRPLAILTLLHHYSGLRNRLATTLSDLITHHEQDSDCQEPLRIFVMSSMHGGTGGALLCEIGLMVRRILAEMGFSNYRMSAVATIATTTNNHATNLHTAAGLASLSEMSLMMDGDTEIPSLHFHDRVQAAATRPFDWVTLIDGGLHGNASDVERAITELSNFAWLDSQSLLGNILTSSRTDRTDHVHQWLRAATTCRISVSSNVSAINLARWCCEQTLRHSVLYMTGPSGTPISGTNSNGGGSPTVSGDFPLTAQACADFNERLLRDLGFIRTENGKSKNSADGPLESQYVDRAAIASWQHRLSSREELVAMQMRSDLDTWRQAIARLVKMRIYNWKQIEQIQLGAIDCLITTYEADASSLMNQLNLIGSLPLSPTQMREAAVRYLKMLSEKLLTSLQEFQNEGRKLSRRIVAWCNSISAEKALNEASWEVNLSGLPPQLQLLANRVNSVLESTVHRLASQAIGGLGEALHDSGLRSDEPLGANFNLQYMLSLSIDLVSRLSMEMGITSEDFDGAEVDSDESLSFGQLKLVVPYLSNGRGRLYRFIVTPIEQEKLVLNALKKQRLDAETTVIPCRRSLDSYVVCDSVNLPLNQIVADLWRPSATSLQLAERLRTRVDVDWKPASALLEDQNPVPLDATQPPIDIAALGLASIGLTSNSLSVPVHQP